MNFDIFGKEAFPRVAYFQLFKITLKSKYTIFELKDVYALKVKGRGKNKT